MQPETFADALPPIASALGDNRAALNPYVHAALDRRPVSSERLLRLARSRHRGVDGGGFPGSSSSRSVKTGQDSVLIEALSAKDAWHTRSDYRGLAQSRRGITRRGRCQPSATLARLTLSDGERPLPVNVGLEIHSNQGRWP